MRNNFKLRILIMPGDCYFDPTFPMDATFAEIHLETEDRQHDVGMQLAIPKTNQKKVLKYIGKATAKCLKRLYKEINLEKEKTNE